MNNVVRYRMSVFVLIVVTFIYLFPAFSEATDSNPYLDIGIFAFEENDFASAISHLKRAMLKQPENPVAYHYLAKTYQKMKRYKEARQYYIQACNIDPDLDNLLYDRGFFYYLTQKYQLALNDFVKTVKQTPENLLAQYYAGICAFQTEQYKIAHQYFLACAKQNSNIKENAEYYAAVCYLYTGKPAQARTLFHKIVIHSQSGSLKKDAKKWLDIIKSNPFIFRPYHLCASITMTYDDNIKLTPAGENVSDTDDLVTRTFVGGNYNFVQSPIFMMGIGYAHSQSNHVDFPDYNMVASKGRFVIEYNKKNTKQSLYIKPEHLWLNDKDYLSFQGIEYDIKWQKNKYLKLLANFEYGFYKNFDNNEYDGSGINFDFGLERTFSNNKNMSFFSVLSGVNRDTNGLDKKFHLGQIGCGLRYQNKQIKWSFGGNYSVKNYLHQDSTFLKRRSDNHTKLYTQVLLTRYSIQPYFVIEHQVNASNINQFDYRKTAISFSLQYLY